MNVTPLVDVVLVLLIIFMVVAPRMDQDVQVDLPGIFNPDPDLDTTVDPLKLSVARAGEYFIAEQKYDLDGAIEVLSTEHAAEPLRRLILRADSKLTYGQVRDILARSQKVGFPGVALMVGERHRPGASDAPPSGRPGQDGDRQPGRAPGAADDGDAGETSRGG